MANTLHTSSQLGQDANLQDSWSMADLRAQLGGIPIARIRLRPAPGSATEDDLRRVNERKDGMLCELIDGVLVEKTMGFFESELASVLVQLLRNFNDIHKLGTVAGPDGPIRILPGQVRLPDVCFVSRSRLANRGQRTKAIPGIVPDLVIEVLSKGNTRREMQRKLTEYFLAGVTMVWYIDGKRRKATVYTDPESPFELSIDDSLDGGSILPGFSLPLRELFVRAEGR